MNGNVRAYFHSKNRLAEEEISSDTLLLALRLLDGAKRQILITTKTDASVQKIRTLTWEPDPDSELPDKSSMSLFMFCGTGNYHEFEDLANRGEQCVQHAGETFGTPYLEIEPFAKVISGLVQQKYETGRKAYGVELLLIHICPVGEIWKIKYNGSYELRAKFGVIGGYQKVKGAKSSLFEKATAMLAKAYQGDVLPQKTVVEKLANQILALDGRKGKLVTQYLDLPEEDDSTPSSPPA